MSLDPRTPVVVGTAQVVQRLDDPTHAREAIDLMAQALAEAGDDAGSTRILARLGTIAVIPGHWPYPDPGALLAARVGAGGAASVMTHWGGQSPQSVVSWLAARIQAGELDVAAVVGGDTEHTRRRRRKLGLEPIEEHSDLPPAARVLSDLRMVSAHESARGVGRPITAYPIIDSAIRHARGETIEEHRTRIATLWHGFNEVALTRETAWHRRPRTVEEIRDPGPGNRMVGFPYTKAMCAENDVDMASALLLCSAGAADALGVPRDRWVFPLAATDAHEIVFLSNRLELQDAPGIRVAGRRALELAGLGVDDLGPIELYSCFPAVVQLTMAALGIPEDRTVTVTGGLTLHGGPLNNYVGQSLAQLVQRVRTDGRPGLLHGNGGLATKHAFAVYALEPPAGGFRHEDVQDEVDALPGRADDETYAGPVTVEAYTVAHGHEGPERAVLAARTPEGARVWGGTSEPATMAALMAEEGCGRQGHLAADGTLSVA